MINLFKQNEGFSKSSFTGKIIDGVEQIPDDIKDSLIQVDEETYQKLVEHKLMWQNGVLVENPNYMEYVSNQTNKAQKNAYKQELISIKQWFTENDWKPNKIVTGEWEQNDPRWLEYKEERAIKRARQDELIELLK